jgi:hypothetical protein
MILSTFLCSLALAFPTEEIPVGAFRSPTSSDLRSPCPGLNILANHGILPRNGREYTREMIIEALVKTYNVEEAIGGFILNEVFQLGLNETYTTISLESIGVHSNPQKLIEHDGSLAHVDFALAGNTTTVDPKLVEKMVSYSTNGQGLSFEDLIQYRKYRWIEAININPKIDFGARPQFLAGLETTLLFSTFKNSADELSISSLKTIFEENRLPADFIKQKETLKLNDFLGTAALIRDKAAPPTWDVPTDPVI